jgi:TetR/AcrR family transcriptional regulator
MVQNTKLKDRPRGRPVDATQQDLKTSILDVAEQLFSDLGYAATSIRHIADQAGVNPALVHYYFVNKKTLLQKVMERVLKPLAQAIAEMSKETQASPQTIASLLLSMAASNPNIPRLLIREVMLPGGVMQQYFIENLAAHLGGALPALFDREKTAGRLREDADPAISAVLVIAMCAFPFIARALAEPVLGIKYDKDGIELLNQQITELLRQGMT